MEHFNNISTQVLIKKKNYFKTYKTTGNRVVLLEKLYLCNIKS